MSAKILVVDDEEDIRTLVKEILIEEGYSVEIAASAKEAHQQLSQANFHCVLLDIWMPEVDGISLLKDWAQTGKLKMPVVMMSGHGTVETAVEATRLGAADFIEKPLSMAKLLATVEKALKAAPLIKSETVHSMIPPLTEPIGKSAVIQKAREDARKIAQQQAATLIIGEAGTGREAFARYVHSLSQEKQGAFINCVPSTIHPEQELESLFGVVKDDVLQPGVFHQAQGGVLFINELEDLSPSAQRLIYGAFEKESFTAVNSSQNEEINFRLISSARPGFEKRTAAQNRLRNYEWPGNMRQFKNVVQRLLVMSSDVEITPADVEAVLAIEPALHSGMMKEDWLSLPIREAREAFEKAYLEHQLKLCDGKVGKLASVVGMERTHLYRKLKTLNIEFGRNKE